MIILSLGSNLQSIFGNRFENLNLAMQHLKKEGIIINKKSSFYETPSYPNKNKPKFINMVVEVKTDLLPINLLLILINIEKLLGRQRRKKNDPRTCDIDIIDYEGQVNEFLTQNPKLIIPHKDLSARNFVLFPLQEILPDWKHPKSKENVSALIQKLPEEDRKSILKIKEK